MSFTDRLLLWFHIGFVIFAIGPVTIATMSTPRYIRARNVGAARAVGMAGLLRRTAATDPAAVWLATTDADTVVPPGWLRRQRSA